MRIEQPKTLEDFKKILETIHELMANPYCDHLMFDSLLRKESEVEKKIEELKNAQ